LLILGICCSSLFIVGLDSTIVNLALPSIRSELGASVSKLQWTIDAYRELAPDCMGRWVVYWRQNMPGLDNTALDDDGRPMKNWWPFLFY
jgi:hypothetical protein